MSNASNGAHGRGRLVIVANRLPVSAERVGKSVRLRPSDGGLATALREVQRRSSAIWVGWPGLEDDEGGAARWMLESALARHAAVPVHLRRAEIEGFYRGFANEVLWPLLHDFEAAAHVGPEALTAYRAVNERFADVIAASAHPSDPVWIHDYHLLPLPQLVRDRLPGARIGFFLHTPFPATLSSATFPAARELLAGVLGADVVGFHTREYADAFLDRVERELGVRRVGDALSVGARRVQVEVHPIGIDARQIAAGAACEPVVAEVACLRLRGGRMLLGVDRMDYTKGIPQRLRAFARLLEQHPEWRGDVHLVQVAVPSRADAHGYAEIRAEVEQLVLDINRRFSCGGWTPVLYHYGTVSETELLALYRAAEVMLVTPLRDGMNLVAKEFVASRVDDDGVLVLGEGAGAAAALRAALRVDARDEQRLAETIVTALALPRAERRVRMRHLREVVARHDVHAWATAFLDSLRGRDSRAASF